jgi:hypothetical protein
MTRTLTPLAAAVLALAAGAHCSSSSSPAPAVTDDSGSDASDGIADVPVVPDATPDTFVPDAGPVTCTKQPAFGLAIRVSHNPDALRNVATASVAGLPDGRVLVVFAEAIDTTGHYAIYARTVDPTTSVASEDERLDVDADNLNAGPSLRLTTLDNGAIVAQWRGNVADGKRLRVYQHGKWSPEVLEATGAMPTLDADGVTFSGAPDGSVMVVRARASTAPLAAATVFHPDEGGPRGSWSSAQALDLDGATGAPTVSAMGRPDGGYELLVWQGTGGPSVRTRSPSGAWGMPSARSDVGARTAQPDGRMLDDGSIVLVGLEGAGDTRQVVTSTWSAAAGWTPARLLSKLPTANGVVPFRGGTADPYLFSINGSKVEFVAWVAGCATVAKDCEFHAVTRVYDGTASPPAWGKPVDLQVGPVQNGADYAQIIGLDGKHPLAVRGNVDANEIDFKVRLTDAWSPGSDLLGGSPGNFDGGIKSLARYYGGTFGLYALVGRNDSTGKAIVSLMGKVTPSASPPGAWNAVSNAGAEMRTGSPSGAYVDGAGGFSIASNDATDGTTTIPLLAHDFGGGSPPAIVQVISADEANASFVSVPSLAPRDGGQDRSAIFLVAATPSPAGTSPNRRLRAYAFNGQGTSVVQKQLANETRGPRSFPQSVLSTGCGGAIAYAVDPADGSHALELVLVQ